MLQNHRAQGARFLTLTSLSTLALMAGELPVFAQDATATPQQSTSQSTTAQPQTSTSTSQNTTTSAAMMGNNTAEVEGHVARAISILDQINQLIDGINQRKAAATGASSGTTNP